jgi:hypothetical protein
MRKRSWVQLADRLELAQLVLDPSPHEDFNGAEFLIALPFKP